MTRLLSSILFRVTFSFTGDFEARLCLTLIKANQLIFNELLDILSKLIIYVYKLFLSLNRYERRYLKNEKIIRFYHKLS